jgi:hypothetical protein
MHEKIKQFVRDQSRAGIRNVALRDAVIEQFFSEPMAACEKAGLDDVFKTGVELGIDDVLFEDRGWSSSSYPWAIGRVWRRPNCPGLLITPIVEDVGRMYTILVGNKPGKRKPRRLTAFNDSVAAMSFCERIAPLNDWRRAADRPPPPGLVERMNEIALEVTRSTTEGWFEDARSAKRAAQRRWALGHSALRADGACSAVPAFSSKYSPAPGERGASAGRVVAGRASSSSELSPPPLRGAPKPRLIATWRRTSRCSSVSGARHGFLPVRKGQDGQAIATHLRTSSDDPAQQSRHFARIALIGDIGSQPIRINSSWRICRGSRPVRYPAVPGSKPAA